MTRPNRGHIQICFAPAPDAAKESLGASAHCFPRSLHQNPCPYFQFSSGSFSKIKSCINVRHVPFLNNSQAQPEPHSNCGNVAHEVSTPLCGQLIAQCGVISTCVKYPKILLLRRDWATDRNWNANDVQVPPIGSRHFFSRSPFHIPANPSGLMCASYTVNS